MACHLRRLQFTGKIKTRKSLLFLITKRKEEGAMPALLYQPGSCLLAIQSGVKCPSMVPRPRATRDLAGPSNNQQPPSFPA